MNQEEEESSFERIHEKDEASVVQLKVEIVKNPSQVKNEQKPVIIIRDDLEIIKP